MTFDYNRQYPSIKDLRAKAKKRIPRFAFEYLDGGCNNDDNLHHNTARLKDFYFKPHYLRECGAVSLQQELFGEVYNAPFGVAPVGLQGLIWPHAPQILAKACVKHHIPYILSTVSTASIEEIGDITSGKAWFQLYYPAKEDMRLDLLRRVQEAGMDTLVLLADVPWFAHRPRDIKNGLSMPPRHTLSNFLQALRCPVWSLETLKRGIPHFGSLQPYMPKGLDLNAIGQFMAESFDGRLSASRVAQMRALWKGKLIVKGIASEEDARAALDAGADGLIVSNHGGRQIDRGEAGIDSLIRVVKYCGSETTVMMDSGLREGTNIAVALACGAKFVFMGRAFTYGVGALGQQGGDHVIGLLQTQLYQILEQLRCENVGELQRLLMR